MQCALQNELVKQIRQWMLVQLAQCFEFLMKKSNWIELHWIESNRIELNWIQLNWTQFNSKKKLTRERDYVQLEVTFWAYLSNFYSCLGHE